MKLHFEKYHGHGNDFIILDNRSGDISLNTDQIKQLCHRRFGIGSDGIILIENMADCDYHMNFYNPDGSQSFCGNGSRCALHFARNLGIISDKARFYAIDGFHEGNIKGEIASISMNNVDEIESGRDYFYLNTGSPHWVKIVDNLESIDVCSEGKLIRNNERFREKGTNVNFLEISGKSVRSRVYERGVENETFSSGTGTTAVALCAFLVLNSGGTPVKVTTRGGELEVNFQHEGGHVFKNIRLTGIVHRVFSGIVEI